MIVMCVVSPPRRVEAVPQHVLLLPVGADPVQARVFAVRLECGLGGAPTTAELATAGAACGVGHWGARVAFDPNQPAQVLWSQHYTKLFHLFVAAGILLHYRNHIVRNELEFDDILKVRAYARPSSLAEALPTHSPSSLVAPGRCLHRALGVGALGRSSPTTFR